jgi:hypothetical protein
MFPINIGLDFGTSFSKMCVRGPKAVGIEVCTFGDDLPSDALIPSKFWVDRDGNITLPLTTVDEPKGALVEYPKMALADRSELKVSGAAPDLKSEIERSMEPLCALFVAHLLGMARSWVRKNWHVYLNQAQVEWSANVGVPVAHLDSKAEKVFARVLAVAWNWALADRLPETMDQARQLYNHTSRDLEPEFSPCQPFPEIGAAVQAFVSSREARPGVHVFFDVGGGTLDGVAFNFLRDDGFPIVNFYSGGVETLGVQALAERITGTPARNEITELCTLTPEMVALHLVNSEASEIPHREDLAQEIRMLVARVVIEAKKKDGRNWRAEMFQASDIARPYYYPVKDEDVRPLIVFMGGGGCRSEFYCDAISSTYMKFGHGNAGVPPYALATVPQPSDMELGAIPEDDFHRFLIAYGLSIPFGEGAEVNLPRAFKKRKPWKAVKRVASFEYENSKDMFD